MTDANREVLDRVRRIETRLTKYLEAQGFDTGAVKPVWRDGVVYLPSGACSIHDILRATPPNWPKDAPIAIAVRGSKVCSILLT